MTTQSSSASDRPGGLEPTGADPGGRTETDDLLARLATVAAQVATVSFDDLGDTELERLLDGLRTPIARLEATRASGFATLERRAGRRAPAGGATAAEIEQRRRNAQRQRLAPSAAKRAAEAGRAATDHAATGVAFRSGDLDTEHVRVIGELLRRVPLGQRDQLEDALVALARTLDPIAFGRRARELVAQKQPEAAARVEQLAANRRYLRAADTADGGFAFSGLLHGTAAETARAAFQAFRRPDTPDEHRTREQAGADAFEQLCEAGLRVGEAPTDHGVRPHVIVVIDEADLYRPGGVARFGHSAQPVTPHAIGHLLDDCTVSRLVRDAAGTPIEVSEAVRTVPVGLWKALLVRDAGCTWDGCDAPSSWCDVAHGSVAFHKGGRLSPANAALLCRRHHRRFDNGPYRIIVDSDTVRYERVATTPAADGEAGRTNAISDPVADHGATPEDATNPLRFDAGGHAPASPAREAPHPSRPPAGRRADQRDASRTERRRSSSPTPGSNEQLEPVTLFDLGMTAAGDDPP
jgi:hypothetical protein